MDSDILFLYLHVVWPYWPWLSWKTIWKVLLPVLERKQQVQLQSYFDSSFVLLWDLKYCILWISFDLFHFDLISSYACEDLCQFFNQSKLHQSEVYTYQSWISYSLNVKNEDELCIYLICKSNSSLHTDQINRSSLILLQKTFLYAIPVYFYVSVHMVNKSGWVHILFTTINLLKYRF